MIVNIITWYLGIGAVLLLPIGLWCWYGAKNEKPKEPTPWLRVFFILPIQIVLMWPLFLLAILRLPDNDFEDNSPEK